LRFFPLPDALIGEAFIGGEDGFKVGIPVGSLGKVGFDRAVGLFQKVPWMKGLSEKLLSGAGFYHFLDPVSQR